MPTDTVLTAQEQVDLRELAARREILSNSEFNHRAHLLIEDARVFAERVESFLCDFESGEAKKLLSRAFPSDEHIPAETFRWGGNTFAGTHALFSQLVHDVGEFLAVVNCDLPPLPNADKEVPRV